MKKLSICLFPLACAVVGVAAAATDAGLTFRDGWRSVYQGAVKIQVDEAGTGFTVTNHSGVTTCIAWGQMSRKFPVAGKIWSLDFAIRADSTWSRVETERPWCNAVKFYDRNDAVVGQVDLLVEFPAQKTPQPFRFGGRVPEGAVQATVQFGVDSNPTIRPGETVQVTGTRFAFHGEDERIPEGRHPDMAPPLVKSRFESPSEDERLVVRYAVEDESEIDWEKVSVSNLATRALIPFRREGREIVLQPAAPWPKGVTRLEIRAADTLGHAVRAQKAFLIGERKRAPLVRLRDDGVTLLRGKPFYPIGIYGVSRHAFNGNSFDKAFADLKAGGLNMGQSYTDWSSPSYFEGAKASDIVSFTWGKGAVRGDPWFLEKGRAEDSIIAWYIGDDTSMHMTVQELLDHDEACRMLDGRRLTCQADNVGAKWVKSCLQEYIDCTDVFLAEIYPYDGTRDEQAVAEVCRAVDRCRADYGTYADPRRPHAVWAILQCFHGCSWHRYPTPEEIYASSFAAVAHGAQGMTWFMYGGEIVEGKSRYSGMFRTPETWDAVTNVMTRISELSPVLLERTPAQPPAPQIVSGPALDPLGKPAVSLLMKKTRNEVYVIAVNAATQPVRAKFTLPVADGSLRVVWEDRSLDLVGGVFEDGFPVNGVHVYRMARPENVGGADNGCRGQIILHGDTRNHQPVRISGAMTAGARFTAFGTFAGVQACCPSYGNSVGELTLSIYPWAGDVASSRARGVLATKRFVDFPDNAWLKLDCAPQPPGEYYAELSGGAEMVGVWRSRQGVDCATSYLDGARVEGSYEFALTMVDCAVPFAGDSELYALQTAPSLAPAPAPAFEGRDLFADTWDAMDGLGRVLGDATTLPAPRARQVGIFYWTWHQGDDVAQNGPLNNAEILASDPTRAERPDDPAWGPAFRRHHWDKPLFGYYRTTDAWVSRRHAQLLAAAGIDNVVFDATNGDHTWMDSFWTLARTWTAMRGDGIKTPQFAFMLPFNENPCQTKSILQLYRDVYRPGKCRELWSYWKGRPLIHANPRIILQAARDARASAEDRRDWMETLRFFTFRPLQPDYTYGPATLDQWCWLEVYPQHGYILKSDGRYEFCAAGVAQNHSWLKGDGTRGLAAMNDRNVFGRAYVGPSESELKPGEKLRFAPDRNPRRNEPNRFVWGDNFAQQLDHALALDPDYLFVTGWNEWIAGLFPNWMGRRTAFPDQYAPPFSRDIEPSEGVLKDHFYHQLVQGVRRFKGVRPQRRAGENPVYRDFVADTTPRDAAGYGPVRYRDTSGRNDFVECFVEHDATTLVFRARCAAPITPHTDARWMRLFLSCGLVADDPRANWEHFHFVVNRAAPPDAHTAILEACTGGWNWKEVSRVPMEVAGDTLTLRIPRTAIGQGGRLDVRFKWADNAPGDAGDVLDFYRFGDAAPDARFLYRYFD